MARLLFEQRENDELEVAGGELTPAAQAATAFIEAAEFAETAMTAMAMSAHMPVFTVIPKASQSVMHVFDSLSC